MSKKHSSTNYTSCMKIDGVPILPPLLTPDRRKEMAYYKDLAIAVEERIKLLKDSRNLEKSKCHMEVENTNFYSCGDHNYQLVFADSEPQITTEKGHNNNTSKNLVPTPSCPNQITHIQDNTLEIRNYTSAPTLQRSNSYTLDSPSPMLQAQLEKQGVFENGKASSRYKENHIENHIGGCGDNIGQTKVGMKRKLPMKYAVKSDYNGYLSTHRSAYESDLNTDYVSDHSSTEFLYPTQIEGNSNRKENSVYSNSSNTASISSDQSNDLETTIDVNVTENETIIKDESYQTSQCNDSFNGSVMQNTVSQKTSYTNDIIIPLEAQKSIQNLFETIQNNHTAQMQKLMEQQKADQEMLKQAFEKQQAVLLNEIHKSYSLSKLRKDHSNNSMSNPEQEVHQFKNIDDHSCDFEEKRSIGTESGSEFVRASQVILTESRDLLNRANSSIESYVESQCPSAKLSQDCLSSTTSSIAIARNQNKLDENTPNTTMDMSDQFYTPVDTPIKSKLEKDYIKSVRNFNDLKIEDMNEETDYGGKDTICGNQDCESFINCDEIQDGSNCINCETQDEGSCSNISMGSQSRINLSNSSSMNRVSRAISQEMDKREEVDPQIQIQERAATVICAAARSFLVRRLLKTQKVCSIKRAIRETLLCALKLHGEGGIKTTDADLHRRLIQQLNSACHELHDIFFKTTIAERMRMISCDRDIMTGCYRHPRAGSTMSTNSADHRNRKYSVDCRQHSRHTSSRSLDKHIEANYGKMM